MLTRAHPKVRTEPRLFAPGAVPGAIAGTPASLSARSGSHGPASVMLTTDAVGGIWRYSLDLAAGFIARGAEVLLAAMGPAPSATHRAEATAVKGCTLCVTRLPLDWMAQEPSDVAVAARTLASLAAEWGADTIQLHSPALTTQANWPAPVVAVAHSCVGTWWRAVRGGPLPPDLAWRADLVRAGLLAAGAVLAPSRAFAAALAETYGVERTIRVVPNGTRPAMTEPRTPHRQVLTAGRLWDEGKNIRLLDEAAGRIEWPVRAAGPVEGPNGAAIACRHIRLLGTLGPAGLAREYARSAVFVSVARYEPFGLAVLEAAQAGCALVLSDIASFRELWDGAAEFVPSDDPQAIADRLRELLEEPERCADLGNAACARSRGFGVDAMAEATWTVHRDLMAAARATPAP